MAIEIKQAWGKPVVDLAAKYNQAVKANDNAIVLSILKQLLDLAKGKDLKVSLRAAQALEKVGKSNWTAIKAIGKEIVNIIEKGAFVDKIAQETVVIALRWAFPEIDPRSTSAEIIAHAKKSLS